MKASSGIRFFTAEDAPAEGLKQERVAVVGYGHLGRPFALNLRDHGVSRLTVGNIEDAYADQARADGFPVMSIPAAVGGSDILLLLLSDEVIPEVFQDHIAPYLEEGKAVVLASGYNLAYGLIQPPTDIDVLLLAPRMAGENARQRYQVGEGFYAYVSVEQESSGRAWQRLLGLAEGVGVLQAGALELSASLEADLDLYVEQTVGAVMGVAILTAFSQGAEAGIPPEALIMEMYMSEEMEMVWRAFREQGFFNASNAHGPTAMFGGFIKTMEFMGSDLADLFLSTLDQIRSGEFAERFQAEREAGYPILDRAIEMTTEESPLALAEERLRALMAGRKQ